MPTLGRNAQVAARRADVLRMRIERRPYREIAAKHGITESTARTDYQRGLDAYVAEQRVLAATAVELEEAKLDQLEEACWEVLRAKHYTVSNGKLIYLADEPLEDDGPVLQAADRLLRIAQRRAALRGFDAPAKVEVDVARAAEIRKLAADLAALGGAAAGGVGELDESRAGPADSGAPQG